MSHAVGSENHKHSLQTGDQEEGTKQRTAHRPQDTQTKGFGTTLLLGVSSEHRCRVSGFHCWRLRKLWHALKKCKRVLHSTQLPSLQATNTLHSHLLHCHTPCFQFVLYTQLSVSGTCFNLSFISKTHHKALFHKTTNSFSPPSKKFCPKEHAACEITCTARWDTKTEGSSAP